MAAALPVKAAKVIAMAIATAYPTQIELMMMQLMVKAQPYVVSAVTTET